MPTTTFDPWLDMLRAKQKYLSPDQVPLAVRGAAWIWELPIEGDWTGAVMTAFVRSAPDASIVRATIGVSGPFYDPASNLSTFFLSLASGDGTSPDSTGSLPVDSDGDGYEYFPMAVWLNPAGDLPDELLFGTALTLSGKV